MQITIDIGNATIDHALGVLRVGGIVAETGQIAVVAETPEPARSRVTVEFDGYNFRRMGKPWIARVTDWPLGGKAEIEWGRYLGDSEGGVTEVSATAGDIVRYGQKNNRNPRGTIARWGIVKDDLSVEHVSESEAREHWLEKHAA